ncbi:MAG: HD domain-containing phosphohydrolase, partial [Bacillota bacterium]
MRPFSPLVRAYFILMGAAGAAVFIAHAWALPKPLAVATALSGMAMAVSELAQTLLPSGEGVSVGWAVIVCSVVALGPVGTAWVQFIGSTVTGMVRRTPILPYLFNMGNMIVMATAGAYAYQWLGGTPDLDSARSWSALGMAMGLIYVGNSVVAALAFSLYKRDRFLRTLAGGVSRMLPSFALLLGFGVAVTLAYQQWGIPALAALLAFIIVLHYGLRYYIACLQERAVAGFLSRSEARTGNWRAHSERVVAYATAIAGELGLKRNDTTLVRYSAWLHDVAMWDRRLARVGADDSGADGGEVEGEDRSVDRPAVDAAVRGAAAVATLGPLVPVATVIRSQSERFDGKGGPDGLAGEAIPIGARIVAAAEWFDHLTMAGARPLTPGQAVARLREEAGTRFCPRVTEALGGLVARNDPSLAGVSLGASPEDRGRDTRRLAEQLRALLTSPQFDLTTRQALGSGSRRARRLTQTAIQPSLFTLYELGQVLNSSLRLERVLAIVSEVAEELTGVQCHVSLAGDEGSVTAAAAAGEARSQAAATASAGATASQPTLTIPMVSRGRRVGALILVGSTGEAIGDRQLDLLSIIASQAALAVENAKLYSEMEVRLREISGMKRFTDGVLNSLTSGVIVADADGRITLTTPRAREIMRSLNYEAGTAAPPLDQVVDPRSAALLGR